MLKRCIACPRLLFEHPAYLAAGQPRRNAMVLFCGVILRHGGFDERFVQIGYGAFGQFFRVRYLKEFRKALADLVNCDEIFSYRRQGQEKCLGYRFARHLSKQDFVEVELKSDRKHKLAIKPEVVLDPWFKQHNLTLPVHHKLAECFDLFQLDESRLQEVLSALDVDIPDDFCIYLSVTRRVSWESDDIPLDDATDCQFVGDSIRSLLAFMGLKGSVDSSWLQYLSRHPERLDEDLSALREELSSDEFNWDC